MFTRVPLALGRPPVQSLRLCRAATGSTLYHFEPSANKKTIPIGMAFLMAHQEAPNTTIASAKNLSMISMYQAVPLYRNEEFLRDRYLKKRLSTGQIAREIRSARSSVLEGLKTYDIPVRAEEQAHQLNKGQLSYGEKMVNGSIVQHLGEQKVIREILCMREGGLSYGSIASWLNKEGHPTKNRVKEWDRPTVYKICRRAITDKDSVPNIG